MTQVTQVTQMTEESPYHQAEVSLEGSSLTIDNKKTIKREGLQDAELFIDIYNGRFQTIYQEANSGQTEILINGSILFAVWVLTIITIVTLFYGFKECFETYFKKRQTKSLKDKDSDEWAENEVVVIPFDAKNLLNPSSIMGNEVYPPLQILSDLSHQTSNSPFETITALSARNWLQGNFVPAPVTTETRIKTSRLSDFHRGFDKIEETILNEEMTQQLDLIEDGNLSSFLSNNFEMKPSNSLSYFKGGRYIYSMKEMLLLKPFSTYTPDLDDGSTTDYDHQYTKAEILWDLTRFSALTNNFIDLGGVSEMKEFIKEVKEVLLMEQPFKIKPNDHTTKPLSIMRLCSIGLSCLEYRNPNIFLEDFNELMNGIIESGAIYVLFKTDRIGGFLISMIMNYIFCHWHYLQSTTTEIESAFEKWNFPIAVQQRFLLFKYLITLKISGVPNKVVDRFLLHLEVESSYTYLINEAMSITEDDELLELFYCLKRKCSANDLKTKPPTCAPSTLYQRSRTIPGSFSGR